MMLAATALGVALTVLAIVLYRRRKAGRAAFVAAAAVAGLAVAGWAATYGRWEWQTWRHGAEMRTVAVTQFQAAQLPITTVATEQDIALLKVWCYGEATACLHIEDREGNKWRMDLRREGGGWTAMADGAWQIDMVHSAMGGSAQRRFYWY